MVGGNAVVAGAISRNTAIQKPVKEQVKEEEPKRKRKNAD